MVHSPSSSNFAGRGGTNCSVSQLPTAKIISNKSRQFIRFRLHEQEWYCWQMFLPLMQNVIPFYNDAAHAFKLVDLA